MTVRHHLWCVLGLFHVVKPELITVYSPCRGWFCHLCRLSHSSIFSHQDLFWESFLPALVSILIINTQRTHKDIWELGFWSDNNVTGKWRRCLGLISERLWRQGGWVQLGYQRECFTYHPQLTPMHPTSVALLLLHTPLLPFNLIIKSLRHH